MKNQITNAGSKGPLLAVQGLNLVLLTFLLFQILSTGKGPLFLSAIFWSILAGVGAIWILRRPHWGVLIVLTVWITDISPALLGIDYLRVPRLVGALLLISLGLSILRDRRIWVLRVPQVKILLAIGALFLLSTWVNEFKHPVALVNELDKTTRLMEIFTYRLGFLIFLLYFITTRQRIELTVWLVLGLIVVAAMTAFFPFLTGGGVKRAQAAFSLAGNPNRLAFISLFATSLLWFYRSHGQTPRWKTWTLPFLFLLPVTALASGSRSGFLQLVILAALILKEQMGWSPTKRVRSLLLVGSIGLLLLVAAPTAQLMRATTFDPTVVAPGQKSLRDRLHMITASLEMTASDPIFGIGIGNFRWMHQAYYGRDVDPHNSYLWALSSGGIGVLILYLLLFYITYRMLKQLEKSGPRDLLWLSKGLRVNLILFLVFSAFADFWLSDFLYLIVGLTVAMTFLWQRQEPRLAQIQPHRKVVPTPVGLPHES